MISVYTDIGLRNGVAAASYLILSDTEYLCSDSVEILITNKCTSTSRFELIAIYLALLQLPNIIMNGADVEVLTDSYNAVMLLSNNRHKVRRKHPRRHRDSVIRKIKELTANYNVKFTYVSSHSLTHNPNVVVDNMCTVKIKEVLMSNDKVSLIRNSDCNSDSVRNISSDNVKRYHR